MDIQTKQLPKSSIELTIEIKPLEYIPWLEKSARELSKDIKIEGFRPGHAPYEAVKNKVGEQEILNHAIDKIISHTYFQAIQEKKLEPLGNPEIKIIKLAPANNIIYQAKISLIPQIKLGDLTKIKIEKENIHINDKEINHVLEHLAKSRAKEMAVNRPAQNKDLVRLDYNISINNVPQEDGQQKNFEVYLGDSHMVPGFEEQVIGLKQNDHKKFDIKFPNNYFQKNLAGKVCQFDVRINGVYELNIPKIDDQFAKSLGQFENLSQLKTQIKNNLLTEKQTEQEKKIEQQIFEQLIKISKIGDIPEQAIDNEVNNIVYEIEADLAQRGLKIDTWLTNIKKTMDEFKKDLRPQAETRVKSALIIKHLAQQENIQATSEEVDNEIKKLTNLYKDNTEALTQIKQPTYKNHLANIITGQKVIQWLKEKIIK